MKTTLGSMVMLSFLSVVLSTYPLLVAPEAVLDVGNEELRAGVQYYIVSAIFGAGGGGVTMGRNRIGTLCPRDVVQEGLDLNRGLPVTFFPVDNPKDGVVQFGTDLNIRFSAPNFCRNSSTVWKLDAFDPTLERFFVTTGGVIGNPGPNTLNSWFRIEKLGSDFYKIVYCPSVCDTCRPQCGDIGLFFDSNGVRRLALSDNPFTVIIYKKANALTTSSY